MAMSWRLQLRTFMSENLGARVAAGIVNFQLMACEGFLLLAEESPFQQNMQTDDPFFNSAPCIHKWRTAAVNIMRRF